MKIPDVNVLLFARDAGSEFHRRAAAWLEHSLSGGELVGFPLIVLVAFVRISTMPALPTPYTPDEALDQVEEWLSLPSARRVEPGLRHTGIWREQLSIARRGGKLVNDAHLAALAIEHNATLASFDGDFHRFPALRFEYLNAA